MKTRTLKVIFSVILSLLFFSIGCTSIPKQEKTVEEPPTLQTEEQEPASEVQVPEQSEFQDQTETNEKVSDPVEIKYYVNQKNYLIQPIDEDSDKKVVLLTFDDAPQGKFTKDILDILDKHQAKAIFFINGHYAVKEKELLKEIYDRGHLIGNHTWWHENLKSLDLEKTKSEILDVNLLIEEVTGESPKYFRPPFGVMSQYASAIIEEEKMQKMNWSLGSLDWQYTKPEQSQQVIEQVVNNITPGANILMHDKEVTSLALDKMLTILKEKGYSFVLPTEVLY